MALTVRVASFLALLSSARADCAFTQDCLIYTSPDCRPHGIPPGKKAAPYAGPPMFNVCPQYPEVCCSAAQMQSLWLNFKLIFSAFGDPQLQGCPACAQNVKDFWCAFSCSPNQTDFLVVLPDLNMTDPLHPDVPPVTVFHPQLNMQRDYSCAAYAACANTGKVLEDVALGTCEGFFEYQGQVEAIGQGHTFIEFNFNASGGNRSANSPFSTPSVLSVPVHSCCNYEGAFNVPPTPGNTSCPCSTCAGMCSGGTCAGAGSDYPGLSDVDLPVLNGINGMFLSIMYSVTVGLSIIIVLGRRNGLCGGQLVALDSPRSWGGWGGGDAVAKWAST